MSKVCTFEVEDDKEKRAMFQSFEKSLGKRFLWLPKVRENHKKCDGKHHTVLCEKSTETHEPQNYSPTTEKVYFSQRRK